MNLKERFAIGYKYFGEKINKIALKRSAYELKNVVMIIICLSITLYMK